jgi:nucleotide-binding universal stress UspA family protein
MVPDLSAPGDVIGQVAEDLLDTGSAPVLLVGPDCRTAVGGGTHRQAVVCADGSVAASSIEPVVAEWATALGLDVHVVTVLHPERDDLAGRPVEHVLREVHSLALRLTCHGLAVTTETLDDGTDPAFVINRYIERHPSALVATSARGHRHQLHLVVGDTVRHLVRHATVPVLVSQPIRQAFHA